MKKLFVIFVMMILAVPILAQDCDCYTSTRSQALQLMQQKKYSKAITFLEAAKDCPDKPAANDLDRKIQECRDAIKRIEEEKRLAEQRRQEEEARRRLEQEASWRRYAYMNVKGIEFANSSSDASLLTSWGSSLYAVDMRYLQARLSYDGKCISSKSLALYIKVYKPDGTLMKGTSSPEGYTYSQSVTVSPGTDNFLYLLGWGSASATTYTPGVHRWEIWYDGYKVYENTVNILKKPGSITYLYVDNKSAVSTSFSSYGGTETFYVSTDASSWSTWGIPSWCQVVEKTSTSFKLKCNPNSSTNSRSDYMKIVAGDKEVRIDISQSGDSYAKNAEIKDVTVDYDVYEDGLKGMMIHVKFEIDNCESVPCRCVAYFYFSDGTALNDYNQSYRTTNGKVSVGTDFTPRYTNTVYSDLQLFMPYNELHLSSGKHSCYFEVNLYQISNSEFFDTERKYSFTYTKQ